MEIKNKLELKHALHDNTLFPTTKIRVILHEVHYMIH